MSEVAPRSPERHAQPSPETIGEKMERLASHEKAANEAHHEHADKLEQIRAQTHKEAVSKHAHEAHRHPHSEANHGAGQAFVNKELKDMTFVRTMSRIRRQLPASDRALSKVIHQPVVDKVSNTVSKTVARPSGMLGGGLLALIGTSVYYYITKHYGYTYNFFVFLLLLMAGFVLGWLIEMVWGMVRTSSD